MSKEVAVKVPGEVSQENLDLYRGTQVGLYLDTGAFNQIQRAANLLAESGLVPKAFERNAPACFIAIDLAGRMGMHPFMLMQNMAVIHGKPSLSGQLIIGLINQSKRFAEELDWEFEKGSGPDEIKSCTCIAKKRSGGEIRVTLTWADVQREGWDKAKKGRDGAPDTISKWNVMKDMMFRYRTATRLGRLYCPDLLMGMREIQEQIDLPESEFEVVSITPTGPAESKASQVAGKLAEKKLRQKPQDASEGAGGAQTPAETEKCSQEGAGEAQGTNPSEPEPEKGTSWQNKVPDMPLPELRAWALQEWLKAGWTEADATATAGASSEQWTRVKCMGILEAAFRQQAALEKAGM